MNEPDENERPVPADRTVCTGVVTISTSRSLEDDPAGTAIVEAFEAAGNEITVREHVNSDHDRVQTIVSRLVDRDDVEVVVTAGGTGVEPDDDTVEAVEPLLEKELTAFEALFTALAYERVGTRAVTVRTLAGVAEGTAIFCLPGTAETVSLALDEIILPEAATIVERAREDDPSSEEDHAEAAGDSDGEPSGPAQ